MLVSRTIVAGLLSVGLVAPMRPAAAGLPRAPESDPSAAVERLADSLAPPLRGLTRDVLERNPEIAAARARARATASRAPQAAALPDPMAGLTAFLLTPETRVGPQELMASLSQRFPWFGKLALKEQAALHAAAAARADVEALRLTLLTETRRIWYELGFLAEFEAAVRADRDTLAHYEELARARYAAGVGLEQGVVKLQAEITKDEGRLLDIATRRAALTAALNSLRDRPHDVPLPTASLPRYPEARHREELLRRRALTSRPEVAAARARITEASASIDLAEKEYRPDVTLGVTYTLVGEREDEPGRLMPPPDNGDDIFGVVASVNVPLRRQRLAAGVEEAVEREAAAGEDERSVVAGIDRSLGELLQRLPLTWQQLRLFEDVLAVQAEQALRSAEAAYASGALGALDLLDAERVLFDVRTSTARTRADYAIVVARLEGAVAEPVVPVPTTQEAGP